MAMKGVNIAELKNKLSQYLRAVRRGRTLTVLDRDTPIARIVPYAPPLGRLATRRPVRPFAAARNDLPRAPSRAIDPLALLLADRRER
jgi:prevent-host-death family protein